jgi:hypothetical protein
VIFVTMSRDHSESGDEITFRCILLLRLCEICAKNLYTLLYHRTIDVLVFIFFDISFVNVFTYEKVTLSRG